MNIEKDLNPQQKEAVLHKDGPILVTAGAGSGKTRVITYRIAYLIAHHNIQPWNILGVTFTNKAAEEMRNRVSQLVGRTINEILIRTFHSVCVKILRIEATYINLPSNFTIVDEVDKKTILKNIINELEFDRDVYNPVQIGEIISKWKSYEFNPEIEVKSEFERNVFEIYKNYENYKKRVGGLDFDDLLLKTVELFKKEKDILKKYQNRWKYILVDEFQDTNHIQYEFMKLLSENHRNVCAVGDEDQSIYSWRGATVENIFKFQHDFPETKIVKLEQNYRSTQTILNVASILISHNIKRSDKKLWCTKGKGEPVKIYKFDSSHNEAEFVASEILNLVHTENYQYKNIAVFYRTNYLSRSFEMALKGYHIPYIIIGGVRFFERKEVKDILAYLKFIANQNDEISLLRIINTPSRGIGVTTLNYLKDYSLEKQIPLYKVLHKVDEISEIKSNIKKNIKSFIQTIEHLKNVRKRLLSDFVKYVIEEIKYIQYLEKFSPEEFDARTGNISELIQHIKEIEKINPDLTLEEYLEAVSLQTSIDEWDSEQNNVSLMTLHNA
ncbi:MAG TPA: ATP-dependent DNA helicase PcrA, partial [Candidatus Atribacteria bacterium]|nr:ATP-dependent DNA helicase PcrA [Candidatus Atribacteria bacterium]